MDILSVALGYTLGILGMDSSAGPAASKCSQPDHSEVTQEAPQVGIRRALQGRAHNWASICCNGLLLICLKYRQIAACGEPSHMINWPLFWVVWY